MDEATTESGRLQKVNRLVQATVLRDAALDLLARRGTMRNDSPRALEFEPITTDNPYPRLSLLHTNYPLHRRHILNIWSSCRGRYVKVLNIQWRGDNIELISFRRGEWEQELLAMIRAPGVAVH